MSRSRPDVIKRQKFAAESNISIRIVNKFGLTFLENNPEALEALKVINLIYGRGRKVPKAILEERKKIVSYESSNRYWQKNKDNPEFKKRCVDSTNRWNKKNKKRRAEYMKDYREKNKEKIKQKRKEYYLKFKQ